MSILSGAIGTMKKKTAAPLTIGDLGPQGNAYYAGVYNAKQYFVPKKSLGESATTLQWKTSNNATTGTTSTTDGLANSNAMNNTSHPAAYYCRNLSIGSYGAVWFLPAKDELNHIYTNLSASGKLLVPTGSHADKFTGTYYWTSSESSASSGASAWIQIMSGGYQYTYVGGNKTSAYRVRACRTV